MVFDQPFADGAIVVLAPQADRVYVIDNPSPPTNTDVTFRVTALDPRGDTLWNRAYPYEPTPVPVHVTDSVVTATAARLRVTAGELAAVLHLPSYARTATAALASADGTLWLRRETGGLVVEWTSLSPDGEPVGSVALPRDVELVAAAGPVLWGVQRTEAGSVLVRYRVKP